MEKTEIMGAAARYLEQMGFEIREREYSTPSGQADIVAWDGDTLVFAEVAMSESKRFSNPATDEAAVERREKIAKCYLDDNYDIAECPVRFDHVSIWVVSGSRVFIRHYKNVMSG